MIIIVINQTVRSPFGQIKAYLCPSVRVLKGLTEPSEVSSWGDGCQGSKAMRSGEEASQSYSRGRRVGLTVARASVRLAKRECPPFWTLVPDLMRSFLGPTQVLGAVTWRKWSVVDTDESPTSSLPSGWVNPTYKAEPKGNDHAMALRDLPIGFSVRGWQQIRSSLSPSGTEMKGETWNRSCICRSFMELVSRTAQASKWLERGPLPFNPSAAKKQFLRGSALHGSFLDISRHHYAFFTLINPLVI